LLTAAGAVLTVCVGTWARQGDQTGRIAAHLATYGAAFAAYLVGLASARRLPRAWLTGAILVSLFWRAVLVAAPPLLSDDVYRSVWEGRIQARGGNPYLWEDRPEAERWRPLRDAVWARINHKEYAAIYPPVWQLAVRAVVAVRDSVWAVKALLVLCETLTLAALAVILWRRQLPAERLLVLAWSPLALVEVAGGGHNEPLAILLLVLALLALEVGRRSTSLALVALGAQAKLLPALIAVAWARRYRVRDLAAGVVAAALPVLPFVGAGAWLWHSLDKYTRFWRFNETGFALIAAVAPSHDAAVRAVVVLLAAFAVVLALRRTEPAAAALAVVVGVLVLTPNVLPWYALWLTPLLVLRDCAPALLFTGTVQLAYVVYPIWQSGGLWHLGWGIRGLEYGPCLALAAAETWRRRRGRA
jgi:alpha-1,6-mannosyltransferase